jgi:hypothetical protein
MKKRTALVCESEGGVKPPLQKTEAERCAHRTTHGHRCRSLAVGESSYCVMHAKKANRSKDRPLQTEAALLAELSTAAGSLDCPDDVNRVLAKLFRALLDDLISREKAGTLGFLAQMLLRSQREIAYHKKLELDVAKQAEENEVPRFCFNVPRPVRDPVTPDDIARAERELQDLQERAAHAAAEEANGVLCAGNMRET